MTNDQTAILALTAENERLRTYAELIAGTAKLACDSYMKPNGVMDFAQRCHHRDIESLRAALAKGSDGEEVRSLLVGGAQLAQTGSDVGGMPLSVGRSRPDQTATSSCHETNQQPARVRHWAFKDGEPDCMIVSFTRPLEWREAEAIPRALVDALLRHQSCTKSVGSADGPVAAPSNNVGGSKHSVAADAGPVTGVHQVNREADAKDAARYRALRARIGAGEEVGVRGVNFILPLVLAEYAKRHNLHKGSVAGHLDDALDLVIDKTPLCHAIGRDVP